MPVTNLCMPPDHIHAGSITTLQVCSPLWDTVAKVLNRGSDRNASGSSLESMYLRLRPDARTPASAPAVDRTALPPHSSASAGGSSAGVSSNGRPPQGAWDPRLPGGGSQPRTQQQQSQQQQPPQDQQQHHQHRDARPQQQQLGSREAG